MKTLLLITGLSFTTLLSFYPAQNPKYISKLTYINPPKEPSKINAKPARKPISYSAMLRNKASQLPKR